MIVCSGQDIEYVTSSYRIPNNMHKTSKIIVDAKAKQ